EELQEHVLGPWAEDRRKMRKLMEDPIFHHQFNLTKDEQRELTLNQLQELADRKVIGKAYPKAFVFFATKCFWIGYTDSFSVKPIQNHLLPPGLSSPPNAFG